MRHPIFEIHISRDFLNLNTTAMMNPPEDVNPRPKRGRPFGALGSEYILRKEVRNLKKAGKLAIKLSIDACEKPGFNMLYSPADILKLRMYFWGLSVVDQRYFLSSGVSVRREPRKT